MHPYIRRATGREEVSYLHEALIPVLERTKGVPLFQEQLMQIAMVVGDCTGDEADLLRRAMGSKRGVEKIERLRDTLYDGMAGHGITGDLADDIYARIQAFANFGFAESHAISFALLVYASSWLKLHFPGGFLAGLAPRPADGLLLPAVAGGRRPSPRRRGAAPRHRPIDGRRRRWSPARWSEPSLTGRPPAGTGTSRRYQPSTAVPPTGAPSIAGTGSARFGWA